MRRTLAATLVACLCVFPQRLAAAQPARVDLAEYHLAAMEFLRALGRHLRGPLIVVQDQLSVHKAAVKRWLAARPQDAPRVMVEWLSSYARPSSTPPSTCGTTANAWT